MKINKSLTLPLYYQVEKVLENKIISKEWGAGYKLLSEEKLAEQFKVSRITIKRAVLELVNKGLLYRQRGKGTFVSHNPLKEIEISQELALNDLDSEDGDHSHKTINFSIEKADRSIARMINVDVGERVINVVRLKVNEDEPWGIEYTYFPYSLFQDFSPTLIENNLIYNVIQTHYNIILSHAKVFFSVTVADEYQSELLDVELETPLVIWERITYNNEDVIIEYSKMIYRHDKERYYLDITL